MRVQIPAISKVLLVLPLIAVGLVAASVVFYTRLDTIVHSDLYGFGLQFSSEWAENYWTNSWLILGSLAAAATFELFSSIYMLVSYASKTAPSRSTFMLFLVVSACASVASVVLFTRLDMLVNGVLYQFGLQFSEEWAVPYWISGRVFMGLIGVSLIVDCASVIFTVRVWPIVNMRRERLIAWLLLPAGTAILLLALTFGSAISAFVGLGFILWGVVILYAGSKRYVEENMLATLIFPPLENLDRLLEALDCKGKAFFLPPEFLTDFESCRAYVSMQKNSSPPRPENIRGNENAVLLKEPPGVILEPPGADLTKLLESRLGTRLTRVDLRFLQGQLSKVFVENLQLAKSFEIAVEKGMVQVAIEDFVLRDMYEKIRGLTHVYGQLGSPVASAIGCALAKSSGKLVSFESEVVNRGGRSLTIEYRIWRSLPGAK